MVSWETIEFDVAKSVTWLLPGRCCFFGRTFVLRASYVQKRDTYVAFVRLKNRCMRRAYFLSRYQCMSQFCCRGVKYPLRKRKRAFLHDSNLLFSFEVGQLDNQLRDLCVPKTKTKETALSNRITSLVRR